MKKIGLMCTLGLWAFSVFSQPMKVSGIKEVMVRTAEWQLVHPVPNESILTWVHAPFYLGLLDLYDVTGEKKYLDTLHAIGEKKSWRPLPHILDPDNIAVLDAFLRTYEKCKDPVILSETKWVLDIILSRGTKQAMVSLKNNPYFKEWMTWCDALYMSPPVLARMTKLTGEKKYLDYMNTMWWKTSDYLYSKEDSLIYRDDRYIGKLSKNGKKIFWGRGNGWVLAGLARVLEVLPQDSPYRGRFEQQYREMAYKILSLQQPEGLWTCSLLDPEYLSNGESSCSTLFCYALAYGLNNDLLDKEYLPQIWRAWNALCNNINAEGRLGYVQQVAGDPFPFHENEWHIYATGAFLMAGKQMIEVIEK